jgi:4-amino-4-deoxy-L-arabinose transferase-like glycosyltransferase
LPNLKKPYALVLALIVIALPIGLRICSVRSFLDDPDEAEYLSIARHIANGQGFQMSIKWHFLDRKPAIHSAVGERPLLFPMLLAPVLRLRSSILAAKAFNITLGLVSCILFYFVARSFLSESWSLLATVCVSLNPILIVASKTVLADVLYVTLFLAVVLVALRASSRRGYVALGALMGLLHLTRFEGILALAVVVTLLLVRKRTDYVVCVLAAFVVLVTPYYLLNFATNGSVFYSTVGMNFRLRSFPQDAMTDPFRGPLPSSFEFIRGNFSWIVTRVSYRALQQFDIMLSRGFLSVLGPFALIGYFAKRNQANRDKLELLFWNASLQFLMIAAVWASPFRSAYLLPSFVLLMPLAFRGLTVIRDLVEPRMKRVMAVFPAVVIALYVVVNADNVMNPSAFGLASMRDAEFVTASYVLKDRALPQDTIATADPWSLNAFIDRPAMLLPRSVAENNEALQKFTELYQPRFVLINNSPAVDLAAYRVVPFGNSGKWVLFERKES